MVANWSEIQEDILDFLAIRVPLDAKEIARFRSVCKPWKSAVIDAKRRSMPFAPCLILHNRSNDRLITPDNEEEAIRSFYCFSTKQLFHFCFPSQGRRCWGTPYGWLFTMGYDLNINLFNPFSGSQISLPSQLTFPDKSWDCCKPHEVCRSYVLNFALASNPSSWTTSAATPLVIAIYGGGRKLAFANPGDIAWTPLEESPNGNKDILFFNDNFYIVNMLGALSVCDPNTTPLKATKISAPPSGVGLFNKFYLVEMFGDLHLVARRLNCIDGNEDAGVLNAINGNEDAGVFNDGNEDADIDEDEHENKVVQEAEDNSESGGGDESESEDEDVDVDVSESESEDGDYYYDLHYETVHFLVFKFNLHTREWTKMKNLGGHAIFVGNHISFAISASNYPDFRGNCIYFTDDHTELYKYRFCDMGVYDMKRKTVEPIYTNDDKTSKFARPSFFMPTAK
ncbi:SWR1-complex protein 3 [Ranunculus cassubicifolius]